MTPVRHKASQTHHFHHVAHNSRYPAFIVTFDVPVPAAADDDDGGATAASAAESVAPSGDGGQPATKRARVSSGAASSSAGGAASAAAAAAKRARVSRSAASSAGGAVSAAAAARAPAISRPATTLPGGYCVGDEVFFTGPRQTLPSGGRVEYGGKGEVVGPVVGDDKDVRVSVRFPGNQRNTVSSCWTQLGLGSTVA